MRLRRVMAALVWVAAPSASLILASGARAAPVSAVRSIAQISPRPTTVNSSLSVERLRSATDGGEIVTLRCTTSSGGCDATGTLSLRNQPVGPATVLLGTTTEAIPAGQTRALTIGLRPFASALLVRRGTLTVSLEITLVEHRSFVAARELILNAPNPILAVTGADIVSYAKRFTGVPYLYGGNGPATFDCSGFTSYVYGHFGYHLERVAAYQMEQGRPVTGPLQVGDLIFWDNGGHVGIYTGNQTFISATVHRGIWIYSFQIWSQTQPYTTARRILGRPTAGWPATAARLVPRNGGPADAMP